MRTIVPDVSGMITPINAKKNQNTERNSIFDQSVVIQYSNGKSENNTRSASGASNSGKSDSLPNIPSSDYANSFYRTL